MLTCDEMSTRGQYYMYCQLSPDDDLLLFLSDEHAPTSEHTPTSTFVDSSTLQLTEKEIDDFYQCF